MTEQPNLRQHPRFAVELAAEIVVGGERIQTPTKDMSRGGICLISPKRLPTGTEIVLSLSLVLGTRAFSESLRLSGRVVWCTEIEQAFQVGVAFVHVDLETNGFLEMYLRFLEQEIQVSGQSEPVLSTPIFDTGDADKT